MNDDIKFCGLIMYAMLAISVPSSMIWESAGLMLGAPEMAIDLFTFWLTVNAFALVWDFKKEYLRFVDIKVRHLIVGIAINPVYLLLRSSLLDSRA